MGQPFCTQGIPVPVPVMGNPWVWNQIILNIKMETEIERGGDADEGGDRA